VHDLGTVGDLDHIDQVEGVDAPRMTPTELAEVARAMAELTIALRAFIVAADSLYPHLASDLRLRRALRMWRGETAHGRGAETDPADDATDTTPL
jgi:hypothetical protein